MDSFNVVNKGFLEAHPEVMVLANRASLEFIPLKNETKKQKEERVRKWYKSQQAPDSEELRKYP